MTGFSTLAEDDEISADIILFDNYVYYKHCINNSSNDEIQFLSEILARNIEHR